MAQQLSFDLPAKPAHGREDFFVSAANAQAVAMIDTWDAWPARKLVLYGPPGAGKTHLAHVWSAQSGALIIPAADLAQADIPALAQNHVAVEDCDSIAGSEPAETALFHLHNLTLAEGHSLLLTAHAAPKHWNLALPDLASRMQGTPAVELDLPDDRLLTAILAKLFDDRQLTPTPNVIPIFCAASTARSRPPARSSPCSIPPHCRANGPSPAPLPAMFWTTQGCNGKVVTLSLRRNPIRAT